MERLEQRYIIAIVVALFLIVVCYFISRGYYSMYDDMLTGMWKADPDWAERAELDGMLLYIGEAEGWWGESRKCYMIMYANDQVLAAKQIEMSISTKNTLFPKKAVDYYINMTDLGESEEGLLPDETDGMNMPLADIMPLELRMELGVSNGKLILYGDDEDGEETQYAKLYKDAAATDISRDRGD